MTLRRIAGLALMLWSMRAGAAPLRSPWAARATTDAAYSCKEMAALPKDIEASSFYGDEKHSVIDPKLQATYKAAQEPYQATTAAAIAAAEDFRGTGSRAAAACVLRLLDAEADGHAMTGRMSSNQANYVQNWTLGALAVTWLKARDAEPGTAADRARAMAWMREVALEVQQWFTLRHEKGTKDGTNNHFYWAGYAVMSVGIAADDRKLFEWGMSTYNEAMSRVQADGTLPLEMDRGTRALHYHLFALAPLTSMAEFGLVNGEDLYAAKGGALGRLVKVSAGGLADNSLFAAKAKTPQDTPEPEGLNSEDVIWLMPWLLHNPDAELSKLLHSVKLKAFGYLAGFPPG